jgi:hypothetical protein
VFGTFNRFRILPVLEIMTGSGVAVAATLEMAGQRFGADRHATPPTQQVGQIDQAPGGDRIAIVHRGVGEGVIQEVIRRRRDPSRSSRPGAIDQSRPSLGEEAVAPAPEGLVGHPGRPCGRRQRRGADEREQEMGAVADLGTRVGFREVNQRGPRCGQ